MEDVKDKIMKMLNLVPDPSLWLEKYAATLRSLDKLHSTPITQCPTAEHPTTERGRPPPLVPECHIQLINDHVEPNKIATGKLLFPLFKTQETARMRATCTENDEPTIFKTLLESFLL